MRALAWLAEAAAVVAAGWIAVRLVGDALRERRQRRALASARWRRRIVPTADGKVRVEVAKEGVAEAIPVATLDPSSDSFDLERYEAEGRAEELVTGLNASEREP